MTELDIYKGLKNGGKSHDKALAYLYNSSVYRRSVVSGLMAKGLQKEEADILWTDIVIQFGSLVINNKYKPQDSMKGFIKNLANYVFLNYCRSKKKHIYSDIDSHALDLFEQDPPPIINEELKQLLTDVMNESDPNCKELLYLWARDYNMQEITEKLKIVSIEATRKRKHICLKKLLTYVSDHDHISHLLAQYYKP